MTLEQATQKILDKALSLTDGWENTYRDYTYGATRHYRNPALPGVVLVYNYDSEEGTTSAQLLTDKWVLVAATSDDLLKHVEVVHNSIHNSINRAARKAKEESIIAIAQQINS